MPTGALGEENEGQRRERGQDRLDEGLAAGRRPDVAWCTPCGSSEAVLAAIPTSSSDPSPSAIGPLPGNAPAGQADHEIVGLPDRQLAPGTNLLPGPARGGPVAQVAIVARVTVMEGKAEQYVAAFAPLLEQARKEPGTLLYAIHRSEDDPHVCSGPPRSMPTMPLSQPMARAKRTPPPHQYSPS